MSATKRLTWPQCNALRALRDACDQLQGTAQVPAEYATPAQIARMLWPDSDGWKRASNRGATTAGGAMGATMPMKAAVVLRRLRELRCAEIHPVGRNRWSITQGGRRALTDERRLPPFVIGRDVTFEYLGQAYRMVPVFGGGYLLLASDDPEAARGVLPAGVDPSYPSLRFARSALRRALAAEAPHLPTWVRQPEHVPA